MLIIINHLLFATHTPYFVYSVTLLTKHKPYANIDSMKSNENKKAHNFPEPTSYQESIALRPIREKYDRARSSKRTSQAIVAAALIAVGAEMVLMEDGNAKQITVAATAAAAGSIAGSSLRDRNTQKKALHEAQDIMGTSRPLDDFPDNTIQIQGSIEK